MIFPYSRTTPSITGCTGMEAERGATPLGCAMQFFPNHPPTSSYRKNTEKMCHLKGRTQGTKGHVEETHGWDSRNTPQERPNTYRRRGRHQTGHTPRRRNERKPTTLHRICECHCTFVHNNDTPPSLPPCGQGGASRH